MVAIKAAHTITRAWRGTLRRTIRAAWLSAALLALALVAPTASRAAILPPWGSNLAATPTLDTANGDYSNTPVVTPQYTAISPEFHDGADLAVWNTTATEGATAPEGGQVLDVKLKGCAVEDTTAPTQQSDDGMGGTVPANTINFEALTAQADGSYNVDSVAPYFTLPFCSNSSSPTTGPVNTSTVTTYQPIHLCVSQGDVVTFEDVGGFVPTGTLGDPAGPWYDQGVPFEVIAPSRGSGMDSFADAEQQPAYGPGIHPNEPNSGWGSEPGEELMLQVIEGTGDDAYGLCPGGNADEPFTSNAVTCVTERASSEGYPTCDASAQPVYWPVNTSAPTVSGAAQQGQRLTEAHGTWTNRPYGYNVQWEGCDGSGANCQPITGATKQYYYPTAADVGYTLEVREWAINDANTVGPVDSVPTAVVIASSSTSSSSPPGGTPPSRPPAIAALHLNPPSFNSARGTTITYVDSRAASSTLRVIALLPGMLRGRSCTAPRRKKPRYARTCTRTVPVKSLQHQDRAGFNGVKLTGVRPGRYMLEITPSIGGTTGAVVTAHFTARFVRTSRHGTRHGAL